MLIPAKGQKLSYNGESVNVSKVDTFIFLKPGILGIKNPSIPYIGKRLKILEKLS